VNAFLGSIVALTASGASASACEETYATAFKATAGVAAPKDVGRLYNEWCKKNMRVSSAKSMDELCAPLVRKVEQKMVWVPPDAEVTPEIACEGVEKLKARFPEHIAIAEAQMKSSTSDEARKRELMDSAKKLNAKLEAKMREALGSWGKALVKDLGEIVRSGSLEILGESSPEVPREELAKTMESAASLSVRGVETKLLQKLQEALGTWASKASKELAAKKAEL